MTDLLDEASAAIKASARTRKRLARRSREERDDQLGAQLQELSAASAPIAALLRTGPTIGRHSDFQAERAMASEIRAERARVRAMLQRSQGGQKKRRAEPYPLASFTGTLGYTARTIQQLDDELRYSLPQQRKGTIEYREQAQSILDRLDHLSKKLTIARRKAEHWSWQPKTKGGWGRSGMSKLEDTIERGSEAASQIKKLRMRAKRAIAVPRDIGFSKPTTPKTPNAKRRRWTEDEAMEAMLAFSRDSKRPPRFADFGNNPDLPSYAKVYDLFGGIPTHDISEVIRYELRTSKNTPNVLTS